MFHKKSKRHEGHPLPPPPPPHTHTLTYTHTHTPPSSHYRAQTWENMKTQPPRWPKNKFPEILILNELNGVKINSLT